MNPRHGRNTLRAVTIALAISIMPSASRAQADPGQVAFSLEREGKLPEAEAAWAALAKQYPNKAEPLAHLGLIETAAVPGSDQILQASDGSQSADAGIAPESWFGTIQGR